MMSELSDKVFWDHPADCIYSDPIKTLKATLKDTM